MTGMAQSLVDRGIRLRSLPHLSSLQGLELSPPSRFFAPIRGIPNIRSSSQLRLPKDPLRFRIKDGNLDHHERYPGFMYEKIVHQSKDAVARRQEGRTSRLDITPRATAVAANSPSEEAGIETITLFAGWSASKAELEVFVAAIAVGLLGMANKVLYKMALVPMKEYPFFLAQMTTFGYVLVYFAFLFGRYKAGIVTDDMLSLPKGRFVALGALEAIGLATGMAAAAVLSAASLPILMQTFLVWQLILSAAFVGKRYTTGQIAGCLLVVAGVVIVVASGGGGTESLQRTGVFWPVVMILSALFSASASILKESVFRNAKRDVKGGKIDIFVVNSFGSGFQALFVLLLLPFLSNLRGIPFHQLGSYFRDGSACFFNAGSSVGCEGSPYLPLLYLVANMGFNVSSLYLMKISSAILASLCSTASVPLAIYAFTLPLPLLGVPPPLSPTLFSGSTILCTGLALYNFCTPK
ncbi:unnamed protein product [Calypogeia fissa]